MSSPVAQTTLLTSATLKMHNNHGLPKKYGKWNIFAVEVTISTYNVGFKSLIHGPII